MTSAKPVRDRVGTLTVSFRHTRFLVEPGQRFTFGRSPTCDIHLAMSDTLDRPGWEDESISRLAGYFEVLGQLWRVVNCGRELLVADDLRNAWKLLPRRSFVITQPELTIEIHGDALTHRLEVSYPEEYLRVGEAMPVPPSRRPETNPRTAPTISISPNQKLALVALFEPLLRHPHPRRPPATYAEAAQRLSNPPLSRRALLSRIDAVRTKLIAAGVEGLSRNTGLDDESAKLAMYDHLRAAGLISPKDLDLLP